MRFRLPVFPCPAGTAASGNYYLYILPKVAYKILGDRSLEGGEKITDIDEYTLGLGVYYLF